MLFDYKEMMYMSILKFIDLVIKMYGMLLFSCRGKPG